MSEANADIYRPGFGIENLPSISKTEMCPCRLFGTAAEWVKQSMTERDCLLSGRIKELEDIIGNLKKEVSFPWTYDEARGWRSVATVPAEVWAINMTRWKKYLASRSPTGEEGDQNE